MCRSGGGCIPSRRSDDEGDAALCWVGPLEKPEILCLTRRSVVAVTGGQVGEEGPARASAAAPCGPQPGR